MIIGTPYASPNDISLQLDLINHMWDQAPYYEFLVSQSQMCRRANNCLEDVRVGPRHEERIDVYLAENAGAPIVVFVHGGWWRGGTRKEFGICANGLNRRGYTVVMADYPLCPVATIPDITQATRAAIVWAYENADGINGDPERIFVVGHSAGGQQAGMVAVTDWASYGVPGNIVKGVVPMSGIFDMYPFKSSWLQPWLQLTGDTVRSESAVLNIGKNVPPLLVMVGAEESVEFHRQAQQFVDALMAHGHCAKYLDVDGEDHSTMLFQMGSPESPVTNAIVAFLESCPIGAAVRLTETQ
ncbi:alpha/beta hydrolase [Caballeronia sp. GAWG2-1]|uniref:alpha/beta hydrolase n=1 Tax=Caballeronia sp. GAWG2-1 TaxID=2921744 RepID=UPI0020298FCC|nr:alpha/beta hydrolase [Caballeronia sp. GAWG2-1]